MDGLRKYKVPQLPTTQRGSRHIDWLYTHRSQGNQPNPTCLFQETARTSYDLLSWGFKKRQRKSLCCQVLVFSTNSLKFPLPSPATALESLQISHSLRHIWTLGQLTDHPCDQMHIILHESSMALGGISYSNSNCFRITMIHMVIFLLS